MKKATKLLALTLALVMVLSMLAACGTRLNGTYRAEVLGNGMSYSFKGSSVTLNVSLLGTVVASVEGTYKIEDGKITLSFSGDAEEAKEYSGTFDFVQNENSIKIGMFEYVKDGD